MLKHKCIILSIVLLCIVNFKLSSQVDSIEYCFWKEIFKFNISNNKFTFRNWRDSSIVETDSIIFQTSKFFQNFSQSKNTNYEDSVQFAIVSRTLRKYGENILYDKGVPFIRICWFKQHNPIILTFIKNDDRPQINIKIGTGLYNYHGSLIKDTIIYPSIPIIKKILEFMNKQELYGLKNSVWYDGVYGPNIYFFEIYNGIKYNIIVISEPNLNKIPNKSIFDFFSKIFRSYLKK